MTSARTHKLRVSGNRLHKFYCSQQWKLFKRVVTDARSKQVIFFVGLQINFNFFLSNFHTFFRKIRKSGTFTLLMGNRSSMTLVLPYRERQKRQHYLQLLSHLKAVFHALFEPVINMVYCPNNSMTLLFLLANLNNNYLCFLSLYLEL